MTDLLSPDRPDTPAAAPADPPPARHASVGLVHGGWRGTLREFAIVVLGVLCALAAQAWWDHHEERGRERDYLRQLLADTRENERRLDEAIGTDSIAGRFNARAIDALTSTTPPPAADSVVEWIVRAGASSDLQPLAGNYRALIGTGDLRLVRTDSLRALLASYAASLENESERQRQFRQVVSSQATAIARALPFMRRVFLGDVRADGVDVRHLRDDPEPASLLFSLQAANANRVTGLRSLRVETRRVRHALEAEIGASPAPRDSAAR
ncbi:MAG TPA: hypothetical protein VJT67_17195 [Longimicrobiaceae bacterium]|nr:hypothetical protein [Longimicrobiaceae bacterium]